MDVNRKYGLTFLIQTTGISCSTLCTMSSDTPFPTISKGDIIDPRDWKGKPFDKYLEHFEYGDLLKADVIYHHIFRDEHGILGNHDIDIFTKIVKK